MEINSALAAISAILFASGEPVPMQRLSDALELDKTTVRKLLDMLKEKLAGKNSGIKLIRVDNSYQLTTKEEYSQAVRRALDLRRNTPLSPASMEVLAAVAYNQPVTKGYIEKVRGVDCAGIVSGLVDKGLIEECGRLDIPGRPILYGTTPNFLRCFGLSTLEDLPKAQALPEDVQSAE